MHILLSVDKNYLMPLGTTMVSIMENNKNEDVIFHIANIGFDKEQKQIISDLVARYNKTIQFYDITKNIFEKLPKVHGYLSNATYTRLFLTEFLPQPIDKLIYLDCDIIVNGPLSDLWDTDIDNHPVAVVLDSYSFNVEHYNRLQYPMNHGYFNAGMMLINVDYWRKYHVMQKCLDFCVKHPERIAFEDQDIMNYVFNENKLLLPLKYNAICTVFYSKRQYPYEMWHQLEDAVKNPVIIHYTFIKPWFKESVHPLDYIFFRYLALTPWKGMPLKYFYKGWQKYKFIINSWMWRHGIKKRYSAYLELGN